MQAESWPHLLQNWQRDAVCSPRFPIYCRLIICLQLKLKVTLCCKKMQLPQINEQKSRRSTSGCLPSSWGAATIYLLLQLEARALNLCMFKKFKVCSSKFGTWNSPSVRPELLLTPLRLTKPLNGFSNGASARSDIEIPGASQSETFIVSKIISDPYDPRNLNIEISSTSPHFSLSGSCAYHSSEHLKDSIPQFAIYPQESSFDQRTEEISIETLLLYKKS